MDKTRRRLIQAGLLGGTAMAAGLPQVLAASSGYGSAARPLRILVLGGTGFIGPHMVREAKNGRP
jgi:2'-hydroxyisoflavone reductase